MPLIPVEFVEFEDRLKGLGGLGSRISGLLQGLGFRVLRGLGPSGVCGDKGSRGLASRLFSQVVERLSLL